MPASAAISPLRRVLSWGDSIVAGASFNGENTKFSFATEAVRQAGGKLSPTANFNQGVGGERMDQILARFANWSGTPQLYGVFVDGGINDFSQQGTTGYSDAQIQGFAVQLIQAIRSVGARVCWLDLLPTSTLKNTAKRTALNNAAHAALLPGDCFIPTDGWDFATQSYDGTTHPDANGQAYIGGQAQAPMAAAGWLS